MNKLVKSTVALMVVTIIAKMLGFVKDLVLASCYGASGYSDSYIVALNIPTVIFGSIGVALATAFIPIYQEVKSLDGNEAASDFSNNVFTIVGFLSILISIIAYIFAPQIVKLFAIGFKGDILDTTIMFTKVLIMSIIFISMTNLNTSYLQIKNNFVIPGLVGLPFNIVVIISIVLSSKSSLQVLAYGTLLAFAVQSIYLIPFSKKNGFKYKFTLKLRDKYIKSMILLLLPMLIGVAVNQVNIMVDRTLASTLTEGSISALNYANKLISFIMGLFITSIAAVIYPMLSKYSSEKNHTKFNKAIVSSINIIILIIIPITIGAIIFAYPVVKLLFERGEFDSTATSMTAQALVYYSIGMIGLGLRDVLSKIFYSLKDTRTPMINGIFTVFLNIVLNIILIRYMGHSGLALATSIASIISVMILFISLRMKIGNFGEIKILKCLLKSIISSVLMGIAAIVTYNGLVSVLGDGFNGQVMTLGFSVLIGCIVYASIMLFLKIEEVDYMKKNLKSILNYRHK
ncbi:MAG: murein biosynthesis integral membrane protein MurJ [Romboutsia sp.]